MELLKKFAVISCSLVILSELLHIILLYLFSKYDYNVPVILPNFIINWLNLFKYSKADKQLYNEVKHGCSIQITIYLVIFIVKRNICVIINFLDRYRHFLIY